MPPLYAADTGTSLIMLDIVADRYWRLGAADAALVRARLERPDGEPDAFAAPWGRCDLATRAIVEGVAPTPTTFALDEPRRAERRLEALVALVTWRGLLRRFGLARTLDWAGLPHRAGTRVTDPLTLAHGFEAARALAPFGRRCLPDSLALNWLARHHGLPTTLVLGVRDRPFVAHAWVQLDGLVLGDPVETVSEFTPILSR